MRNDVSNQRSLWPVFALAVLFPITGNARDSNGMRPANPSLAVDRAILKANNDTVAGSVIRNSCDGVVYPRIGRPAAAIALIVESDPTGMCVGSNPPSSMTVLMETGPAWRTIASFPGSTFRIGALNRGKPDIVFGYPPFHRDCPILRWDGSAYQLKQPCPRETDR